MKKERFTKRVLILLLLPVFLWGCVDDKYDLEKIDTDNLVVDGTFVGPLGGAVLSADRVIKSAEELEVDEAGNFVIRYSDKIEMGEFAEIEIPDITVDPFTQDITLPAEWYELAEAYFELTGKREITLPASQTILVKSKSDITMELPKEVLRLDRVELLPGAVLTMKVDINGFKVTGPGSEIDLTLKFPDGYTLAEKSFPAGASLDGSTMTMKTKMDGFDGLTLQFTPSALEPRTGDEILIDATLNFQKGDDIELLEEDDSITASGGITGLEHKVIYGVFDTKIEINPMSIITDDIADMFTGKDNVLSFTGIGLGLKADSNIGVPLDVRLDLKSTNSGDGKSAEAAISGVVIDGPATYPGYALNRIWIGDKYSLAPAGYDRVENNQLGGIIKISPTSIAISGAIDIKTEGRATMFFPYDPDVQLSYELVLPLAPASDFKANFEQTVKDAFTQEVLDYAFGGGTVELFGTIENTLPLGLEVEVDIVDANMEPLGVTIAKSIVKSCGSGGAPVVSDLSVEIGPEDMPKMAAAKHVQVRFAASGDAQAAGIALRPDQEVKVDLKFRKTGGIDINKIKDKL